MNSQNPDQQNSSWRQPSYMQESRNQGISRPENYYAQYPSPQMVNDYIPSGYVYPGMMPPFRHGEYNMPQINEKWNPSFGLVPPQAYSKYYNKGEPFSMQNPPFTSKDYTNRNNFFEKQQDFRAQSDYDDVKIQHIQEMQAAHLSASGQSGYPSEECLRMQKGNKNKNVIIIESDEDNVAEQNVFEPIKSAPQKAQEKSVKQLSMGNQIQSKKNQFGIEVPSQSKDIKTIPQVSPIIIENIIDSRQNHLTQRDKKPQVHHSYHGIYTNVPSFKIPIGQFVPLKVVADLHHEIMHELEIAQIPDITMKLFLKYKIIEARFMYEETQQSSFKVFNLLKIYRTIILFEIERKNFIENVLSEQIFAIANNRGRQYNGNANSYNAQKRYQQQWRENQKNFKFTNSYEDLKQKTKPQYRGQQMYRQEYQRNNYQHKTKKISKREPSDHNSQELSFNAKNKYLEKYDLEPNQLICDRKLRQRKKKKNRKDRNEKSTDQKYSKDKPNQRQNKTQNSKTQKEINEKENNKKTVELSHEDEGLIDKIKGWAEKTVLANAIEQKHKKSFQNPKNSSNDLNTKSDPLRVVKKEEQVKKNKQRSTKSSQLSFRQELTQKMLEAKGSKETVSPNLITFATSNNLTQVEKEEYQKQLSHLIKEMRNNDSHGKIRIGKEYFQAKMPNFVRSESELRMMIKEKRQKLMERKMTVITF